MEIVPEDSAARRGRGVRWVMAGAAALVVAADQVSKTLILAASPPYGQAGWIMVRLVRNTGASGGIASGYPVLVTLGALVIVLLAALLAARSRSRTVAISLAVVCGGALGNLADRIFRAPGFGRGGVVDWIHIAGGGGSFNVADTAIQLGVIVTVVAMFTVDRAPKRNPSEIRVQKAGLPATAVDEAVPGGSASSVKLRTIFRRLTTSVNSLPKRGRAHGCSGARTVRTAYRPSIGRPWRSIRDPGYFSWPWGKSMVIAKYELGARQRGRAWALTAMFGFLCVLGGVSHVMEPGWRGPVLLGILAGLWAVFGYAMLSGPVYRAELTSTELRWRTPFRNTSRPLSTVTSMQWNGHAMVVEFGDRKPVLLPLRFFGRTAPDVIALASFAERVRAAAPHVTVAPPPVPWSLSGEF